MHTAAGQLAHAQVDTSSPALQRPRWHKVTGDVVAGDIVLAMAEHAARHESEAEQHAPRSARPPLPPQIASSTRVEKPSSALQRARWHKAASQVNVTGDVVLAMAEHAAQRGSEAEQHQMPRRAPRPNAGRPLAEAAEQQRGRGASCETDGRVSCTPSQHSSSI